jgi:hypothetical protein
MPLRAASLRFPCERVLLARTKLAYVHVRNLLTDAKRDRAARVYGYVAIWLPEEFLVLYIRAGEVVNAMALDDEGYRALSIADAIDLVPAEPELGEICFHEASDSQLACMHFSQMEEPTAWPSELDPTDPEALFAHLGATTFDGMLEIVDDGAINYVILRDGLVERCFLSRGPSKADEPEVLRAHRPFAETDSREKLGVFRWPVPPSLPVQANPSLIQAYRELTRALVGKLVEGGNPGAPKVAEYAREALVPDYPCLASYSALSPAPHLHDPVVDAEGLTAAIAQWVKEIILAAVDLDTTRPEQILRSVTHERRHAFQSAGFFQKLPWPITW